MPVAANLCCTGNSERMSPSKRSQRPAHPTKRYDPETDGRSDRMRKETGDMNAMKRSDVRDQPADAGQFHADGHFAADSSGWLLSSCLYTAAGEHDNAWCSGSADEVRKRSKRCGLPTKRYDPLTDGRTDKERKVACDLSEDGDAGVSDCGGKRAGGRSTECSAVPGDVDTLLGPFKVAQHRSDNGDLLKQVTVRNFASTIRALYKHGHLHSLNELIHANEEHILAIAKSVDAKYIANSMPPLPRGGDARRAMTLFCTWCLLSGPKQGSGGNHGGDDDSHRADESSGSSALHGGSARPPCQWQPTYGAQVTPSG